MPLFVVYIVFYYIPHGFHRIKIWRERRLKDSLYASIVKIFYGPFSGVASRVILLNEKLLLIIAAASLDLLVDNRYYILAVGFFTDLTLSLFLKDVRSFRRSSRKTTLEHPSFFLSNLLFDTNRIEFLSFPPYNVLLSVGTLSYLYFVSL